MNCVSEWYKLLEKDLENLTNKKQTFYTVGCAHILKHFQTVWKPNQIILLERWFTWCTHFPFQPVSRKYFCDGFLSSSAIDQMGIEHLVHRFPLVVSPSFIRGLQTLKLLRKLPQSFMIISFTQRIACTMIYSTKSQISYTSTQRLDMNFISEIKRNLIHKLQFIIKTWGVLCPMP